MNLIAYFDYSDGTQFNLTYPAPAKNLLKKIGNSLQAPSRVLFSEPYRTEDEKRWQDLCLLIVHPEKQLVTANDRQEGGDHYKKAAIEPWDFIVANNLGFLEGNIIKYVARYESKNGMEDLKKARHYLDKLIEVKTQGN